MKTILSLIVLLASSGSFGQTKQQFNVHFDLDRYSLTPQAIDRLDSFLYAEKAAVQLALYGHCDNKAGDAYNDLLSVKRVQAVKEYLIRKGVNKNYIVEEKGFGKRKPLNSNHGETEMYLNRRVEVLITRREGTVREASNETVQREIASAVSLTEKINDTATKAGTNIVLRNLNFYGGTHIIIPQSLKFLIELLDVMKKNPTLEIAVEGHICCQGGDADGYDIGTHTPNLSENRAREICNYLAQNGIAQSRLKYKGFGHQRPLTPFPEKTEEERSNNRRVEIKILKR